MTSNRKQDNPARRRASRIRRRRKNLRESQAPRIARYFQDIVSRTFLLPSVGTLIVLWLLFSAALYFSERSVDGAVIDSYGDALYWGIAAFSTAGIADTPISGLSLVIGGLWIVTGSVIFFGTIVAAVTSYFMRPVQHPIDQIVDTIEYNLEHLEDLSIDELDLLKKTTDDLILHIERLKKRQQDD